MKVKDKLLELYTNNYDSEFIKLLTYAINGFIEFYKTIFFHIPKDRTLECEVSQVSEFLETNDDATGFKYKEIIMDDYNLENMIVAAFILPFVKKSGIQEENRPLINAIGVIDAFYRITQTDFSEEEWLDIFKDI